MPLFKKMPYLWSELQQYGRAYLCGTQWFFEEEPIEESAELIVSTDQLASFEEVEAPVLLILAALKDVDVEWH